MKIGLWNGKKVTSLNIINSKNSNSIKQKDEFEHLNLVVSQIWKNDDLSKLNEETSWFIINELINLKNKKIMKYIKCVGIRFDIHIFNKFLKIKRVNPYNIHHVMLRDSISMELAEKNIQILKNTTAGNKDNFIKRHGKTQGSILFDEFSNKSKHTKDSFIKKYGTVIGEKKFLNYLASKDSNSIQFFIKKYGETLGYIKYKNNRDEKKYLGTKEYYITKYGRQKGEEIFFNISKSKGRDKDFYIKKYGETYYIENILQPKLSYFGQEYVIPFADQTDFQEYSYKVRRLTEKQPLYKLEFIDNRGSLFHLDHKFSIANGFLNNVPIHIIAHISNLEIIPSKENLEKHTKNTIELEELYNRYKKDI